MQSTDELTGSKRAPFGKKIIVPFWALFALSLAACGGGNDSSLDSISVQLDWTPNTNHIGIYIALANGWYEEANIEVDILPYSDANPDVVVANGQADIGVSFPPNLIFSRAAGLDLVSVASVLQTNVTELAVLASSDIRRPRDLDGKIYAGFGFPFETPQIETVIRFDGGEGDFDNTTLSTFAYEALYNERADFTDIFTAWEGIEAQLRGVELRSFRYEDYGVPDFPSVILVASAQAVDERADVLRRFLSATRRGYEFAASEPEAAAQIFVDFVGQDVFPEPDLVRLSSLALAEVFVDSSGSWGLNNPEKWETYTAWLLGQGVVLDGDSNVVSAPLPGDPLFINSLFEED